MPSVSANADYKRGRMMFIAYLVDAFPVTSETFVINEIDEMSRQGEDIHVISLNTPALEVPHKIGKEWKRKTAYLDQVELFFVKNLFAMLTLAVTNPIRFIRAIIKAKSFDKGVSWKFRHSFWLASYLRKINPQHIHVHFASEAAELAWMVNWLTGIPFSVTTHGYDIYEKYSKPYRFIAALGSDAAFIRSVCKYNVDLILKLGVPPNKIPVIHCGIRVEQFSSTENVEKDIDIICVARLHPVKGISFLIDAVAALVVKFPMIRVCIVGDGGEREALVNQTVMRGLTKNFDFSGPRSQNEIRALLLRSKVFCLPSLDETVGVANMEAMAMGLPVVSTTVKGIPELIADGETGLLVPPGNPVALTDALYRLLDDARYREILGESAKKYVLQHFNQVTEVGKLRNIIHTSSPL